MKSRNLIELLDTWYAVLMSVMAIVVLYFNYYANLQSGIIDYFRDYKEIILAGFDPTVARLGSPTYPMWGYGWVFLVSENKIVILVLQAVIALLATCFLIHTLKACDWLESRYIRLLKLLVVVSVPWWAFHAALWPASLAASFSLLSVTVILPVLKAGKRSIWRLAMGGVLAGVAANFRSDALFLPAVTMLILVGLYGVSRRALGMAAVYVGLTLLMLVPWCLYTRHVTGHVLLTSTNSGLTSWLGIGHVPDNRWNITVDDDDPALRALVESKLGYSAKPTTFEADRVLQKEYRRWIRDYPSEFLKVCFVKLRVTLFNGVYPGEFFLTSETGREDQVNRFVRLRHQLLRQPLRAASDDPGGVFRTLLQVFSSIVGRIVVLASYLLLPVVGIQAWRRRNPLLLTGVCMVVCPLIVILLFSHSESRFLSPVYPYYLMIIVGTWQAFIERRRRNGRFAPVAVTRA